MTIPIQTDICQAMAHYNKEHPNYFITIDGLVLNAILSGNYTNDSTLAHLLLSSLSTIKRSINKLCNFGFLTKHVAPDHTKTLTLHQDVLNKFISDWS